MVFEYVAHLYKESDYTMDMNGSTAWVVVGIILLALVGFTITVIVRTRPRYRRRAANRKWLRSFKQAKTEDAILNIGDMPYPTSRTVNKAMVVARERYQAIRRAANAKSAEQARQKRVADQKAQQQAAAKLVNELRQQESSFTYTEVEEFFFDHEAELCYLTPEDKAYMDELIARRTRTFVAELYEEARQGDGVSMETLVTLVTSDPSSDRTDSQFQELTGEPYTFPSDWNELVVRLFESPSLEVFADCEREPALGIFRRHVSRALLPELPWIERLIEAEIVLAYVATPNDGGQYIWREELGLILLAKISEMIALIRSTEQIAITPSLSVE
jgi:hypothetical protein